MRPWVLLLALAGCATTASSEGPSAQLSAQDPEWNQRVAAGQPTLVVFATVWCEPCAKEWPQVLAWAAEHEARRVLYVVSGSAPERVYAVMAERAPAGARVELVVDTQGQLARDYGVQATPTLFLHTGPKIHGPPVHSMEELEGPAS